MRAPAHKRIKPPVLLGLGKSLDEEEEDAEKQQKEN